MSQIEKEASAEFLDYLKSYSADTIGDRSLHDQIVRKAFKRYYPLLLLERGIDRRKPWSTAKKLSTFRMYLRETISDICQAMVLGAQGYYKPSQLSLRSGLENWVRCVGLAQDQNVLPLTSVFELMDLVGDTPLMQESPLAKQYFSTLRQRYALLCGYVHTSTSAHMALTTAAGEYPRFIEKDAVNTFDAIAEVSSRAAWMFTLLAPNTYRGLHHSHYDMVNDILPVALRRALN